MSGALWQRIRQHGRKVTMDPRLATELGRLNCFAELTNLQTAAGFRVAEIYGRFEGLRKLRRVPKGQSIDGGFGEAGLAEELMAPATLSDLEESIRSASEAFDKLQELIDDEATLVHLEPRSLRATLEQLCVEDKSINPTLYDAIRQCLEAVALKFGVTNEDRTQDTNRRAGTPLHFNTHLDSPSDTKPQAPRPANLGRESFIKVVCALNQTLTVHDAAIAWETQQTLEQRARFIRDKAKIRSGATVDERAAALRVR
jgi:hypothetical protein